MTCEFAFLAVGNADSIIACPQDGLPVVVDLPQPRSVSDFLVKKKKLTIGSIYITHAHRDHFAPFTEFVAFLEQWFELGGGVTTVFIAHEVYQNAFEHLDKLPRESKKYKELHHALERLMAWRGTSIQFSYPNQSLAPSYQSGNLAVYVLHPEQLFTAKQIVSSRTRVNERSIVLKLTYKGFAAILLADVERDGLGEMLKLYSEIPDVLQADLLKIPHHGAWPANSSSLETILKVVDPQLAILSVGSKNNYGHVVPALFHLLNKLIADLSLRLNRFICTEVTRTCLLSSSARNSMGKRGLEQRMPCAGNIIVTANDDDTWIVNTETDHVNVIKSLPFAACEGRCDY